MEGFIIEVHATDKGNGNVFVSNKFNRKIYDTIGEAEKAWADFKKYRIINVGYFSYEMQIIPIVKQDPVRRENVL